MWYVEKLDSSRPMKSFTLLKTESTVTLLTTAFRTQRSEAKKSPQWVSKLDQMIIIKWWRCHSNRSSLSMRGSRQNNNVRDKESKATSTEYVLE